MPITLGLLDATAADWAAAIAAGMQTFAVAWIAPFAASLIAAVLAYVAGRAIIEGAVDLFRNAREYQPRHVDHTGAIPVAAIRFREAPTEALPVVQEPRHSTESRTSFMSQVQRVA